jgi:transposase-like protein
MGHQRSYSWEVKLQMVQLLEKGEHNPSKISRDHQVTRSLLYVWWQLYQERGEAAFVPTQAFHSPPEADRPQNAQEQIVHLERLCGQQALERGSLRSEVDVLKKAWHLLPHPLYERVSLLDGSRCQATRYASCVACCRSTGSGITSIAVPRLTRRETSGFVRPSKPFVRRLLATVIVV